MTRFEYSLDIDCPPPDVFCVHDRYRRMPEWQSGVVEVELQGPMAQGARERELRKFLGRRL